MSQHYKLYNTVGWKRRRKAQLTAHPLCAFHLKKGQVVAATIADHVDRHNGNPDKFYQGALQSLCKPCHDSAKQAQEKAGFSKEAGLDGWPVDPAHPANRARP